MAAMAAMASSNGRYGRNGSNGHNRSNGRNGSYGSDACDWQPLLERLKPLLEREEPLLERAQSGDCRPSGGLRALPRLGPARGRPPRPPAISTRRNRGLGSRGGPPLTGDAARDKERILSHGHERRSKTCSRLRGGAAAAQPLVLSPTARRARLARRVPPTSCVRACAASREDACLRRDAAAAAAACAAVC